MLKIFISIITCATLLSSSVVFANEAKRYDDNVTCKNIVKINFKIGKRSDALKIIKEHFKPAAVKSKTPQPELLLELHTGDYDVLTVWHMEDGIKDMTWDTSPNDIAWRAALNELSGGKDKAQKILDEYRSYIESAENDIAMVTP
jgi:hypothetical protein